MTARNSTTIRYLREDLKRELKTNNFIAISGSTYRRKLILVLLESLGNEHFLILNALVKMEKNVFLSEP